MEERRRHARHPVDGGVLLAVGPYTGHMGQIQDIGNGGLSFRYKGSQINFGDTCDVSIVFETMFAGKYGPFKYNARIVSDRRIEDTARQRSADVRQCHMQFNGLSYHQRRWLEACIANYGNQRNER